MGISKKEIGYDPSMIVDKTTPQYLALKNYADNFNTYPAFLFFWDVDVPASRIQMLELYGNVTTTKFSAPFPAPNYVASFSMFNPPATIVLDQDGKPNRTLWYQRWHAYSEFPANASIALPKIMTNDLRYIYSALARVNEFAYWPAPQLNERRLRLSYFPFLVSGVVEKSDLVTVVDDVKEKIENNPHFQNSKAYAYGVVFVYWDVFLRLEGILFNIFFIVTGVIFVINALFLMSLISAIICSLMCFLIVLEVYGLSMRILQFNMFMGAILLAAMGIAVEDVVHSVAYFVAARGSVAARLSSAMSATFPAIIQGSLSSMLSLLPLGFHPIEFYQLYYFIPFELICVFGLLNGLFFTPTMLALMGTLTAPCTRSQKKDIEVSV